MLGEVAASTGGSSARTVCQWELAQRQAEVGTYGLIHQVDGVVVSWNKLWVVHVIAISVFEVSCVQVIPLSRPTGVTRHFAVT
jgi:hypothetical protein